MDHWDRESNDYDVSGNIDNRMCNCHVVQTCAAAYTQWVTGSAEVVGEYERVKEDQDCDGIQADVKREERVDAAVKCKHS